VNYKGDNKKKRVIDMNETTVVIVRALITFISLLIFTRILGKQQIGNLTFFDYINGITIGSIAGNVATDLSTKAWVHWIGLLTFILIALIFQFITLKSHLFSKIIDSEPVVVIQDGKILEDNLRKLRVKCDELLMLLRQKDIFDVTMVQYGILEGNGHLSVMVYGDEQPVRMKDLNIEVQKHNLTSTVILNGTIIEKSLKFIKKDKEWLLEQLKQKNIDSIEDVSLAMILPTGKLYVDLIKDELSETNSDFDGVV
jgi:uncharacterized membrane protein YcaP (DUF421 family)